MNTYLITLGHFDSRGRPIDAVDGVPFYRYLANVLGTVRSLGKVWTVAHRADGWCEPEDGRPGFYEPCTVVVIETDTPELLRDVVQSFVDDTEQDSAVMALIPDVTFVEGEGVL